MGAYFVKNTLKYKIKSSNFGSQRLVTKSMVLTILMVAISVYRTRLVYGTGTYQSPETLSGKRPRGIGDTIS